MGVHGLQHQTKRHHDSSEESDGYYDGLMYKTGRSGVLGDLETVKQEIMQLETTSSRDAFNSKLVSTSQRDSELSPAETMDHISIDGSAPPLSHTIDHAKEFVGEYLIGGDGSIVYGEGTWSKVFKATLTVRPPPPKNSATNDLPTPPSSPASHCSIIKQKLLAVKAPTCRAALPVLEKEARILTYLTADGQRAPLHIISFLGYDTPKTALVLEAVPLTLHAHTSTLAMTACQQTTAIQRSQPVVGTRRWLSLASSLIAALTFLKDMRVVHGDIKPRNILLRESSSSSADEYDTTPAYTPVLADFSSSHVIVSTEEPEEVSATTTDYTAPELLLAMRKPSPANRAVATYATDVFALGVTLIEAATGESVYECAKGSSLRRNIMASEGRPLEFARCGDGASRVKTGGVVDRVVRGAVKKGVEERIEIEEWGRVVEEVVVEI